MASFAGFAPINDPAITVAVILDSAVGLHQGGQVSAPVFQRVTQQVLEYLHTPHDVELPPSRQVLLAERRVKEQDVEEGSPDRLGDSLEAADRFSTAGGIGSAAGRALREAHARGRPPAWSCLRRCASVNRCSLAVPDARANCDRLPPTSRNRHAIPLSALPSIFHPAARSCWTSSREELWFRRFWARACRAAIEMAQESGLDLDAVGSGLAREQSPPPGSHVASGSQVTVKFGR